MINGDAMYYKPHIPNLILKLSRIVSLLCKAKDVIPLYVLRHMYNAHIVQYDTYNRYIYLVPHIPDTFTASDWIKTENY